MAAAEQARRFRAIEAPATFGALAPQLSVGSRELVDRETAAAGAPPLPATPRPVELERDGLVIVRRAAASVASSLASATSALVAASFSPLFLYVYDETWTLGEAVRAQVSSWIGHRYELVEDVWAWHIAPGRGRGWPPHRGVQATLLDRDAPELLNVWVALSDVETDRACMHFVPLDEDPGYPRALAMTAIPAGSARALPLDAGDALVWNANVLHWGGQCAIHAKGPRIACSFTLVRSDAQAPIPRVRLRDLAHGARLDILARQVQTYAAMAGADPDLQDWAQMRGLMVDALRARQR